MRIPILLPFLIFTSVLYSQSLSLYDLNCEHKTNPIGIDVVTPRLSWKIKADGKNIMQVAYALRISESPDFSKKLFWKSDKIRSSESNLVAYSGPALESTKRYYWQVKVWDNENKESQWSETAFWEMGFLDPSEWKATWIEPAQDTLPDGPAFNLRKEFDIRKDIARARIYATSHGIYELHLNGQKIGTEEFTPGWTTYQKRLQYQVFDISELLKSGQNAIGVLLGDGWYKGRMGWQDQYGYYGKKVSFLGQMVIEYKDGTNDIITTDKTWKSTSEGPIRLNSIYNGETYDARMELVGWNKPGYQDQNWKNVKEIDYGPEALIGTQTVPIKTIQELKPIKIWTTPRGTLVADMGQNMVGWIKLKVRGVAGQTITLRHAEVLDKEGEFYTENLRDAQATIRYTLKGNKEEVYEPRFTFMGFRYVAIEGFSGELKPDHLTGVVVHSDIKPLGTFECSNPLINQLQQNIQWGQKGNFLDVPTDCPQRDERMGWTGDAQAFARTAAYNMDVAAFFTKWLKDVAAEQDEKGAVPFVIPNVLGGVKASAGWADVVTIAPWTMYQVYGDKNLLAQQYPSMKKYVDFIRKDAGRNFIWEDGSVFGDWLFFKPELTHWTVPDGHTDQDLIATAFYGFSTKLLVLAAKELDLEEDVKAYTELFEKIKKAFNDNYVTPAGRTSSDSQTSYVLALMFDLLPEEQRSKAIDHLVKNIKGRGNHLSTGFLGTPYICHVLSENGHVNVAYDLLLQESFPSWLYPVKMGATTIWERWDGLKPDSTFQNKGMNSFNHYAYGAIGDWMYRVVAGIEIGTPGYKEILIQPQPDNRLDFAKASYESRYGTIVSEWKIEQGHLFVNVEIPPNTSAQITLPKASLGKVKESGIPLTQNYKEARETDGNVILTVGSGKYAFEYNTSLAVKVSEDAPKKLVEYLMTLAAKEENPLLKEHFETVAYFTTDTSHGFEVSKEDIEKASMALNFFQNEGAKWETYENGPRPLMLSFRSPTDGKRSYYWLIVPQNFDPKKENYPLYVELHGSGGGLNDNPRKMLYHPLQPEVAGVTNQGYRKEGLFIHPWGRGDKWYRDVAEADILEVLADFDKRFKTDPKRQYLYGFSMGGAGTFQIAQKTLDRWAALGMYSGAFRNPTLAEAKKLKGIPIWMTWGEKEWSLTEVNRQLKGFFLQAGVKLKWKEVEGVGHRYLGEYQEDLMDWLKTHQK